jgi:hypothetical protein
MVPYFSKPMPIKLRLSTQNEGTIKEFQGSSLAAIPNNPILPQERNRTLAQYIVVKDDSADLVGHADTDMERQQMLFAWMAIPCGRRLLPLDQALFTLGLGCWAGAY